MNSKNIKSIDAYLLGAITFLLAISTIFHAFDQSSPIIWLACTTSCTLLVVRHIKTPPIFILTSYFLYFATSPYYFYIKGIPLTGWSEFQSFKYFSPVIYYLNWFVLTFSICITGITKTKIISIKEKFSKPYNAGFFVSLIFCLLTLVFGLSGDTILDAAYYQGETDRSALHEYFIAPFFSLLIFADHQRKSQTIIIKILLIGFVLKTFLYGGRIEVLQIALLYIYYQYNFLVRVQLWKLVASAIAAYLTLTIVGLARSDIFGIIEGFQSFDQLLNLIFPNHEPQYISNTSSEVIYSSARLHGLVDIGAITSTERALSFFTFLFNSLAPSSFWPDYANLSRFKSDIHSSNGGALISSYFYVWLGFLGPALAGIFTGIAARQILRGAGRYFYVYAVLVLITFPRWFTYNPTGLLKFCLIGTLLIFILEKTKSIHFANLLKSPSLRKKYKSLQARPHD